ncbi:hypothetical protein Ae201684P_014315 [Aphanomyces euteiches]|uniref:DDE Tnp4 domain-containing protein n=1 Tax=Aphanomyces euteiches TaxID=100861 RepID=A0A6G0WR84_9STRA|nr:hypothetical protein Ae201684_012577 [Aphanomyces euteiches]KAH9090514.1 hypothetical protein Ae201684P_014315 [Aphanomyces euteiches]
MSKFRFNRMDIMRLIHCFGLPDIVLTPERTRCSSVEAVCILLRRLAVADRWIDIIDLFGRSISAMSNIFLFTIDHLHARFKRILYLDHDRVAQRLQTFCDAIKCKGAEIDNVWAFIDGTVRACSRPLNSAAQRSVYNGHKRKHSLKFQTLVTPDGIIVHVFGPVEGRRHDLTILRRSKLETALKNDQRFRGYIIFGDPAYGRSEQFASPFSGSRINAAQHEVNKSMSRVRVSIEWSYSQIIRYWSHLENRHKMCIGKSPISKIYKIAILLTNCVTCCRRGNTNSSYFRLNPPELEEYLQSP